MVGLSYTVNYRKTEVPLKSVTIDASVVDCLLSSKVTQTYLNDTNDKINCNYSFNLDKSSIVTGFDVIFSSNGRHLKGILQEKVKARRTFDTGVSEGKKACILQDSGNGHYNVELGNVDINEIVSITYTYISILPVTLEGYRYILPTNISEKYTPNYGSHSYQNQNVTHADVNYTFDLTITWRSGSKITNVKHGLTVPVSVTKTSDNERVIHISGTPKDGDLSVTLVTETTPSLYIQPHSDNVVYTMLATRAVDAFEKVPKNREYIVIVDRSGSMNGDKIESAKNALKLYMQSLPDGSRFNIVSFGSEYKFLFPFSVVYDDTTKAQAINAINKMDADMGGTEILQPLQYLNTIPLSNDTSERIILLLTDGAVTNEDDVVKYVSTLNNTRCFTMGIGNDVSRSLVERVATVGHGTCTCIIDTSDLSSAVADILELTTKLFYTNLSVRYESPDGTSIPLEDSLADTSYVYPNTYYRSFALLNTQVANSLHKAVISGKTSDGDSVEWSLTTENFMFADNLDKFFASKRIQDLTVSDDIVKLSVKHNIMNNYVSMVVVDDQSISSLQSAVNVIVPHYGYNDYVLESCAAPAFAACNLIPQSGHIMRSPMQSSSMPRIRGFESSFVAKGFDSSLITGGFDEDMEDAEESFDEDQTTNVNVSPKRTELLDFQRTNGSFDICQDLLSVLKVTDDVIVRIMTERGCTREFAIYHIILEVLSKESKYRMALRKTQTYMNSLTATIMG